MCFLRSTALIRPGHRLSSFVSRPTRSSAYRRIVVVQTIPPYRAKRDSAFRSRFPPSGHPAHGICKIDENQRRGKRAIVCRTFDIPLVRSRRLSIVNRLTPATYRLG